MKTIRMPKKLLAKWLRALRGGTYTQGCGVLYEESTCSFCCLGVLQHAASRGSVEVDPDGDYLLLPTLSWLNDNGVVFLSRLGTRCTVPWIGEGDASDLNDEGMRFKDIAALIERHAEGY